MHFVPLLGKQLKDDEIIEVLEGWDSKVTYEFDRLHEGQPDTYWAASLHNGIELRFDSAQVLTTVFLYVCPDDSFHAVSPHDCDVPFFETASQVEEFGIAQHLSVSKGQAVFLGAKRDWVRLNFGSHTAHYEFRENGLALITLALCSV